MPSIQSWKNSFTVYKQTDELPSTDLELLEKARRACKKSYSPYSGFSVGACLLLENGKFVEGVNQENAAYPSGLCAERVALFASGVAFPNVRILSLVIAARPHGGQIYYPSAPCGACRQVMVEFEEKQSHPISVLFQGDDQQLIKLESCSLLMPFVFNSKSLVNQSGNGASPT